MLRRVFKIPIYFGKLVVIVSEDLQQVSDNLGLEFNAHGYGAFVTHRTLKSGHREYVVALLPTVGKDKIAHESKHVVNRVFEWVGVKLDVKNDEAECYLLEWVFGSIEQVFDEYNEKKEC